MIDKEPWFSEDDEDREPETSREMLEGFLSRTILDYMCQEDVEIKEDGKNFFKVNFYDCGSRKDKCQTVYFKVEPKKSYGTTTILPHLMVRIAGDYETTEWHDDSVRYFWMAFLKWPF